MTDHPEESNARSIERSLSAIHAPNQARARAFLLFKEGQHKASNTRRHYADSLERLDAYLNGKPWRGVDAATASGFLAGMLQDGLSPYTVQTAGTYSKAFLAWNLGVERLPRNLREAFKINIHSEPDIGRLVPQETWDAVYAAIPGLMDQTFFAVLWETGFRISECRSLNIGSVTFDDKNGAWLSIPKGAPQLKTGPRSVYVTDLRAQLLRAWIQTHPDRENNSASLWPSNHLTGPTSRRSKAEWYYVLDAAIRQTSVKRFTPHDLRHTAATRDAENGYNEIDLRTKYGWTDRSTMPSWYVKRRRAHQEAIARASVNLDAQGQPIPIVQTNPDTKTCPACAEEIKAAATKCKHCGERITART